MPRIVAFGTAVPDADVHDVYADWARRQVMGTRQAAVLDRMIERGGIDHRFSVLSQADARLGPDSFYTAYAAPTTAQRMDHYAASAPALAEAAVQKLPSLEGVTHIITASCTGFMAPGLDQVLARQLGLAADVQRLSIGFMGCYAGITLLRTAAQIVRADPAARVLAIAVELCTLHMQETDALEPLLAMGQFADGAAATLVCAEGEGMSLGESLSTTLPGSDDLITWHVGDTGFTMHLSGEVPGRLAQALSDSDLRDRLALSDDTALAVHPGGKSILDAVERALDLDRQALGPSRDILRRFGNMSSATVIFVLEQFARKRPADGLALAFGPGLAMEGLRFGWADDA